MQNITREWLTMDEVATALGVSTKSIRRWITSGHLKASRFGPRAVRIHEDELERLGRDASKY